MNALHLDRRHTNQAGNAGDCTSGAHSSLPWRRLGRFFAATVLTGFVLNEIWEMAQMSAYIETADRSWTSGLGLCTWAAAGDMGIILGGKAIYQGWCLGLPRQHGQRQRTGGLRPGATS
jgi:hypothetical protein